MGTYVTPDTLGSITDDLGDRIAALERTPPTALSSLGSSGPIYSNNYNGFIVNQVVGAPYLTAQQSFKLTQPGRVLIHASARLNLFSPGFALGGTSLYIDVLDDLGNTMVPGSLSSSNLINESVDYSRTEAFSYPAGTHWVEFRLYVNSGNVTIQCEHQLDVYGLGA